MAQTMFKKTSPTKQSPKAPEEPQLAQQRSKSQKTLLVNEFNWNENFNVMASKNNQLVHESYREFFDKPIDYDVRGYA